MILATTPELWKDAVVRPSNYESPAREKLSERTIAHESDLSTIGIDFSNQLRQHRIGLLVFNLTGAGIFMAATAIGKTKLSYVGFRTAIDD